MRTFRLTVVVLTVIAALCTAVTAATVESQVELDVKVATAHLWRGQILNDDSVIQPSLTVTAGDWALNLWGTWDIDATTNSSARQRIDTTIEYSWIRDNHILTPGLTAYVYHDATYAMEDDTVEASLEYAYLVIKPATRTTPEEILLIPSITLNYDFGEINGLYSSVAFQRSFKLAEDQMTLNLRVDLGAADKKYANAKFSYAATGTSTNDFTPDSAGLIDLTLTASAPVALNERWSLTPSFKFMTLLDSDIKDAADAAGEETEETALSITISAEF
ncbi:hypothetical protein ACFLQU_00050 [Verrucomicrobiota bacterium]